MPVLSQQGMVAAWGPPCAKTKRITINLNGTGRVTVQAAIGDAVMALDAVFREHDYLTRASQTGAGVCRHKVGSDGWSIHSLWVALDINWLLNPQGTHRTDMTPAMRRDIKAIRTSNGVQVWACGYDWDGLPDPMHIEICCAPRDIAHGIDLSTVPDGFPGSPGRRPAPAPPTPTASIEGDDEDMVRIVKDGRDAAIYKILGKPGFFKLRIPGKGHQLDHALAELDVDADGNPLTRPATANDIPIWDGDDLDAIRTV